MNLKWVWNVSEMWLKWIWKRLARTSFLPVWAQAPIRELSWRSVVWSSITSSLRHSRLGQERSEEEGCLTTLTMWRSHGCYLRCSPARNKSMDSACRARIRSGFAARDSCPNVLSTYFLLDIAYIAALFLLKIHNLQNTMPLCEDGYQKRNKSCILAVKSGFLPELSEHLWGFS